VSSSWSTFIQITFFYLGKNQTFVRNKAGESCWFLPAASYNMYSVTCRYTGGYLIIRQTSVCVATKLFLCLEKMWLLFLTIGNGGVEAVRRNT